MPRPSCDTNGELTLTRSVIKRQVPEIYVKPKLKLPTFAEYSKGPAKPPPPTIVPPPNYASKLPSINQGRSVYDMVEEQAKAEESPLIERVVFGLATAGIAFLIIVEIVINSPLMENIKPILNGS